MGVTDHFFKIKFKAHPQDGTWHCQSEQEPEATQAMGPMGKPTKITLLNDS